MPPLRTDIELQEMWTARLEEAKLKYMEALAEFRRVTAECRALRQADCLTRLREAAAGEARAGARYAEVLRVFTGLMAYGIPPGAE